MRVEELRKLLEGMPANWEILPTEGGCIIEGGFAITDTQGKIRGHVGMHRTDIEWRQSPTAEDFNQAWEEEREATLEKAQQHVDYWTQGGGGTDDGEG